MEGERKASRERERADPFRGRSTEEEDGVLDISLDWAERPSSGGDGVRGLRTILLGLGVRSFKG